MKKRLLILSLICCLFLCGCEADIVSDDILGAYVDTENEDDDKVKMTDIKLLYYPDMDTNPITTTCYANHELLKLVYSPLIRVGESFRPYCELAEGYTLNGNILTVTLRSGLVFSDGSAVSSSDVVKSVKSVLANTQSPYYNAVSAFSKYYASDDKTIVFELKSNDIDAPALLDIPIMKNGQSGIGCGAYAFSVKNGKNVLVANEKYFKTPSVSQITLVETKSDKYLSSLFSMGELDVISVAGYDDLSLISLRDYTPVTSLSNNFIYIGLNFNNPVFADVNVRKAISVCIDRDKIAQGSLVNLVKSTVYPFNPDWYRMKVYNVDANPSYTNSEIQNAVNLLKDKPLKLAVPKNSDIRLTVANELVTRFNELGLTLELIELESAEYTTAVTSGNYELYLGETAISRTMDPTYLYSTNGKMNYTGFSNLQLDSHFEKFKSGETGFDTYLDAFYESMPVIPLFFRKNVMYCASGISGFTQLSPWNSLGDITTVMLK